MPPSRHSSSSHHSSSRSHHSSHSSHSSRSSYSRSASSSYRSSSSGYGSYRSSYSANTVTKKVPRGPKTRYNQPKNYTGKRATHEYRCKTHDYIYYGEDWIDSISGTRYARGYYDEAGKRYDQVIFDLPDGSFESTFDCIYCGTQTKQVWKEGAIPHCENCGANLIETMGPDVVHDQIDNTMVNQYVPYQEPVGDKVKRVGRNIGIAAIVVGVLGGIALLDDDDSSYDNDNSNSVVNTNIELFGETFYYQDYKFEWYDEYDSYYNEDYDVYVWYDTDDDPAVWQYWYEGISSDYGDYGWMEYELDEDQWYIEVDDGDWVTLPSKYDADELLYFTGNIAGTSYTQDYNLEFFGKSIKIDGSTKSCVWDEEYVAYYVKDEDCYVRVNFDVVDPTPQYWYEDVSSEYCDEDGYGGWLEYDYDKDCWYVYDMYGDWNKCDEADGLWHIESSIVGYTGTELDFGTNSKELEPLATYDPEPFKDENFFFVMYFFNPSPKDYVTFDRQEMIINFEESEDSTKDFTANYIEPNKDIVKQFFDQEKDNQVVTTLDELTNNYYSVSKRLDITDWLDEEITIVGEDGEEHTYKVYKAELAIQTAFYEGDKKDYYDDFAEQYVVEDNYVFVQGVQVYVYFE